MPKTYIQTENSTARLFVLKRLLEEKKQSIIMSDNTIFEGLLKTFSSSFCQSIIFCESIGEIFSAMQSNATYIYAHTDIFRIEGNWYHIQKTQNLSFKRNELLTMESAISRLLEAKYEHDPFGEKQFSYNREWGVIKIIQKNPQTVYEIEWFGDEIDSILVHQKTENARTFENEITLSSNNFESTKNTSENIKKTINTKLVNEFFEKSSQYQKILIWGDFLAEKSVFLEHSDIHFSEINQSNGEKIGAQSLCIESIYDLLEYIKTQQKNAIPVKIFTRYQASVREFLENNSIENIEILPVESRKMESFEMKKSHSILEKMAIIADDIIGKIFVKKRKSASVAKNLDLLISLLPGDYIVHRDHGVWLFVAIVKKTLGNLEREYLEIHYAEGDKLFVPITEIFRISKYLGENSVTLTRLGWKEWEKTLQKTDEELQIIAENILETNAKRQLQSGRAFAKFPEKEQEFRNNFPYEYTADQLQAIFDVFADMESPHPMDRLLSGDVGFWKTEVAMNSAFKAVLSGTQVAVISPLVVLALEHFESFSERMKPFGIKIAILSRMSTEREAKKVLEDMKNGNVQIVIGTHRLLSDDIKWKKLWLLIVDEEHKFGVIHKEKIKKIRAGIDILSLSATPIPRSLNLAMSGLRQITLLSTPPKKKKPIETIITTWNENIAKMAISNELKRWGQIIIVHNRIRWIESFQNEIASILASENITAKSIITHGRMTGDEIENRIFDFKNHKYDILITTTIIENGVNFLSANTIIIMDPEDFWLASLHQLRGRVGRKNIQGFCYLTYRKLELNPDEKERLLTIANNSHLGAGFEIAMRDMEIRGAGDILGIKQSGKSKEVWLPLYFRMLEEKIKELKNEKQRNIFTKIELDISYILDDSLFLSELDKLNFFREAENIETLEELDELQNSLKKYQEDAHMQNFFLMLRARLLFSGFEVAKISKNLNFFIIDFLTGHSIVSLKKFLDIFDSEKNMIVVTPEKLRIPTKYYSNSADFLKSLTQKI